jgi:hypothetical protein
VFVQESHFLSLDGWVLGWLDATVHSAPVQRASHPVSLSLVSSWSVVPVDRRGCLPPPRGRCGNILQQFARTLTDEHGLVIGNAITVQQRTVNFFVDTDEITDFFS